MDETLHLMQRLLECIRRCADDSDILSAHINRGIGGREVSLAKTNLQQAEFWLAEGRKLVERQ